MVFVIIGILFQRAFKRASSRLFNLINLISLMRITCSLLFIPHIIGNQHLRDGRTQTTGPKFLVVIFGGHF
jgi:hypothetical protein